MSFNRQLFSAALRSHLAKHHLSIREAAKATGVSASTLSRLTNNEEPDINTFASLISWLEVDANVFLSQKNPEWAVEERWAWLYHDFALLGVPEELVEAMVTILRLVVKEVPND